MTGPVYCFSCDNVHSASRDENKPWNWRCAVFPRPAGYGFVHPSFSPDPPYRSCRDMNPKGECEHFKPLRRPAEIAS